MTNGGSLRIACVIAADKSPCIFTCCLEAEEFLQRLRSLTEKGESHFWSVCSQDWSLQDLSLTVCVAHGDKVSLYPHIVLLTIKQSLGEYRLSHWVQVVGQCDSFNFSYLPVALSVDTGIVKRVRFFKNGEKTIFFPIRMWLVVLVCVFILMQPFALGNYSGLLKIIPIVKTDSVEADENNCGRNGNHLCSSQPSELGRPRWFIRNFWNFVWLVNHA